MMNQIDTLATVDAATAAKHCVAAAADFARAARWAPTQHTAVCVIGATLGDGTALRFAWDDGAADLARLIADFDPFCRALAPFDAWR